MYSHRAFFCFPLFLLCVRRTVVSLGRWLVGPRPRPRQTPLDRAVMSGHEKVVQILKVDLVIGWVVLRGSWGEREAPTVP